MGNASSGLQPLHRRRLGLGRGAGDLDGSARQAEQRRAPRFTGGRHGGAEDRAAPPAPPPARHATAHDHGGDERAMATATDGQPTASNGFTGTLPGPAAAATGHGVSTPAGRGVGSEPRCAVGSGRSPVTMYSTRSPMLTAWSPMRS